MGLEMARLNLHVTDASRQRQANPDDLAPDSTVSEFIERMVRQMRLEQSDVSGRPLVYQVLHEKEGRHLHASETLGAVVEPGDSVVLHPEIDAGSPLKSGTFTVLPV